MTRRELLALVPAAAAQVKAAEVGFERIDSHLHVHRPVPAFTAGMQKAGWRAVSLCVSRAIGDESSILPEMLEGTARAARESGGRLAWAAAIDPRGFEQPDFVSRTIAELDRWFKEGAIAVKVWKNIGMSIRAKSGAYLMPDNPALLDVYAAIQKAGRSVVAHLAEPTGAWLPIDEKNPEINYYKSNPQWHMSNHPGAPKKEEILNARDRVLARFPKLRLVGCHLGSNEDDLPALARRLDRYANFAVDCAARVRYLVATDRAATIQFLTRYQDRILYGTDFQVGNTEETRAWNNVHARMEEEYQYFASSGTVTMRNREVQGLGLPESVVRKIFGENAKRWLPNSAG
jgi:predicted TIM-barrel fold metal-dependent hydrolase